MAIDVVLPNSREKEFIEIAERLGYDSLIFLYGPKKSINKLPKFKTKLNIYYAVFAKENSGKILSSKPSTLNVVNVKNKDSRKYFESNRIDIIYNLEIQRNSDFIHQRASGFNQILANLAVKNETAVAFSLDSLLSAKRSDLARIIGRIKQNILLCRKYKVKMVLASFADSPYRMRSPHDMASLGVTFGMHPKEAQEALDSLKSKIKRSAKKKKTEIAEGVETVT